MIFKDNVSPLMGVKNDLLTNEDQFKNVDWLVCLELISQARQDNQFILSFSLTPSSTLGNNSSLWNLIYYNNDLNVHYFLWYNVAFHSDTP